MKKLKIIVGGNIGLYPTGGATWDYIQYPLGLKLMGHDVYYIEDTMQYPVFQKNKKLWDDATDCINYLASVMLQFEMSDKWAYRDIGSKKDYGMSTKKIIDVCKSADIFINISCSTVLREEYSNIPQRILIDTDPMFTQIQYAKELNREKEALKWNTKKLLENHNYLFTFGENINNDNCLIPAFGLNWITTRQPICLQYWENENFHEDGPFTTVMNWSGRKKLTYNHIDWGQKDVEFEKIRNVPTFEPGINFEIVLNKPIKKGSNINAAELRSIGWKLLNSSRTVSDTGAYRKFIIDSAAEFSIAKETYVKSNSGWFSCRSACYLAASKPVITQETGWSKYIPSGKGLLTFTDQETALEALREVKSNYKLHSRAAKEIANNYFDSKIVLREILDHLR